MCYPSVMKITKEQDLMALEGVRAFAEGDKDWFELSDTVRDALYEFFQPDMPYGIQKARTGDPDVWIAERLERYL